MQPIVENRATFGQVTGRKAARNSFFKLKIDSTKQNIIVIRHVGVYLNYVYSVGKK